METQSKEGKRCVNSTVSVAENHVALLTYKFSLSFRVYKLIRDTGLKYYSASKFFKIFTFLFYIIFFGIF